MKIISCHKSSKRKDAFLHMFFVYREILMHVVVSLGHSDDEMVEFEILNVMRRKFNRVSTVYFKKENSQLLK